MILQRNGLRLLVEMAVIVATAAVTGFAHLAAWAIVGSVVVVWLAISVFEYSRSHLRVKRRSRPSAAGPPAEQLPPSEPVFERLERVRVLPAGQVREAAPVGVGAEDPAPAAPAAAEARPEPAEPEPFVESVRVLSGPRQEPANGPTDEPEEEQTRVAPALDEPAPEPERVQPEPEPEAEPEPEPERVPVPPLAEPELQPVGVSAPEPVAVPDGERESAAAPALEPEPWPERRQVREDEPGHEEPLQPEPVHHQTLRDLDGEPSETGGPRRDPVPVGAAAWSWNVWNLERVVRERASSNEELNYLLLYLRDYANPAGMLPPDFDALVRESFGDLLAAPA